MVEEDVDERRCEWQHPNKDVGEKVSGAGDWACHVARSEVKVPSRASRPARSHDSGGWRGRRKCQSVEVEAEEGDWR